MLNGKRQLRLALVCARCLPGDVATNLATHESWIRRAVEAGAQFVGFPECSMTGYRHVTGHALSTRSEALAKISSLARACRCFVAVGLIENNSGRLFNTHLLFGPRGLVGAARKINLTKKESRFFRRGNNLPVFNVNGCKLGIAICADATYYEVVRVLALRGAEVIFAPHATYLQGTPRSWIEWRMKRWPLFAEDAVCAIAGCNNAGLGLHRDFAGGALVVDHTGKVAARSHPRTNTETMIVAELDLTEIKKLRQSAIVYSQFQSRLFYSSKMLGGGS